MMFSFVFLILLSLFVVNLASPLYLSQQLDHNGLHHESELQESINMAKIRIPVYNCSDLTPLYTKLNPAVVNCDTQIFNNKSAHTKVPVIIWSIDNALYNEEVVICSQVRISKICNDPLIGSNVYWEKTESLQPDNETCLHLLRTNTEKLKAGIEIKDGSEPETSCSYGSVTSNSAIITTLKPVSAKTQARNSGVWLYGNYYNFTSSICDLGCFFNNFSTVFFLKDNEEAKTCGIQVEATDNCMMEKKDDIISISCINIGEYLTHNMSAKSIAKISKSCFDLVKIYKRNSVPHLYSDDYRVQYSFLIPLISQENHLFFIFY